MVHDPSLGPVGSVSHVAVLHANPDVVAFASNLGEYAADVVARIAFDFQDERGRSPLRIVRVPAQELPRERVQTSGVFPEPTALNIATPVESPRSGMVSHSGVGLSMALTG